MKFDYAILKEKIPGSRKIFVYFLGGAGFIFKFDNGKTICIDPYLSDFVERMYGFKRLFPAPLKAEILSYDMLLLTHEHGDHLDIDIIETLNKNNPSAPIIAPENCDPFFKEKKIKYRSVKINESTNLANVQILIVDADHGDQSPLAIGYVIIYGDRSIYFTGDTAFNTGIFDGIKKYNIDILIPCINGAFGNMSESDAAELAKMLDAKIAVPSHYGLFEIHGGDTGKFKQEVNDRSPATKVEILKPGEGIEL